MADLAPSTRPSSSAVEVYRTAPSSTPASRPPSLPGRRLWLHPVSGGLILGLDWLFFGAEVLTLELALPIACVMAFVMTCMGVTLVQRFLSRDSWLVSLSKGLAGGFLAGLPFPIGGTLLGSLVLILSGLSALHRRN